MTPRSSGNEGIHMLPEFVCEAIPAPGLSMPPRTTAEQNGQGNQASAANGSGNPEEPRPDTPAEPKLEADGPV
jgi:hypothetical protein